MAKIQNTEIRCPEINKDGYCHLNDTPCLKDFSGVACEIHENYLEELQGELVRE